MLQNFRRLGVGLLAVCAIVQIGGTNPLRASGSTSNGTIALTAVDTPYTQNFDTLASSGSTLAFTLAGWTIDESGTSTVADGKYAAGTGSGNAGDIYSFGLTGSTDRALGTLLSGTNTPTIGAAFTNDTGSTITSVDITYTGEQWRLGTANRGPDRLDFQYSTNATALMSGSFIDVDALDFSSPVTSGTLGALNGNVAANRNTLAATIDGLSIAPGATFWIRWLDFNASSSDDGLAIDDFSLTPHAGGPVTTNPSLTATATPDSGMAGDQLLFSAIVTPGQNPTSTGLGVTIDLSAIGGTADQMMYDDGTHGDLAANDGTFSVSAAIDAGTPAGPKVIQLVVSDAQSRSGNGTVSITVVEPPTITPIHDIQGPGTTSPLAGQKVTTRGIVTGVKTTGSKGFFVQAPDSEADADPNTSEGVFVYTGSNPPASAAVGNLVIVAGTVQDYVPSGDPYSPAITEISGSPTVTVLATGQSLPAPVTITAADLNPAPGIQKLERLAGMRVHIDELVAAEPTGGNLTESAATSTSDGLFAGMLPGTAQPFREPGIETPDPVPAEAVSPATVPIWDANPERIAVATGWLSTSTPLDVTTGVVVQDLTGPLDYTYRMYCLDTERTPTRVTDNVAFQPVRVRKDHEFTVATMNLERFYDAADDTGKSDTVLTADAFNMRLAKASMAVRSVMSAPDIIGFEEVENIETLTALAAKIFDDSLGTLDYAPYLMEGNDVGGIDVALLVRKDRATVIGSPEQLGKDTMFYGDQPPSHLNDRPSLIVRVTILNAPYDPYPVTIVVNHLKAMSGIDGPSGARNRQKRLAQTIELAAKLQAMQSAGEAIISVGDYNAFDVNDGYTDIIGMLKGTEAPAEQVTLWSPSPVAPPLTDLLDLAPADQRYSYVYDGNKQAIDHILVSSTLQPTAVDFGRMDADFPEVYRGDASRPERLSDHDPIVGYFSLPDIDKTAPTLTLPASFSVEGNTLGGATVSFNASAFDAVDGSIVPTCSKDSGALFALGTTTVTCTAVDGHGNRATGTFTVTVTDTTPPSITALTPSRAALWPPNQKLVSIVVVVTVTDVVDATPACRITDVTGTDGATGADWTLTGPLTLGLRAERTDDAMDGRVYTMTVTCTDASGNTSSPMTTTVTVPHDQRK